MFLEQLVAFFLGNLDRHFSSGTLDDIENSDETYFVLIIDDGKCLGFCGDTEVRYAHVTSGSKCMNVVVRISGGAEAKLENPFIIFQNKHHKYPIRGVPDDVPGVCYRTGPKGCIDDIGMQQLFSEPLAICALPDGSSMVLLVGNFSAHNFSANLKNIIQKSNTEIRFLRPNETHLLQLCDSFVTQKIKAAWTSCRERYKETYIQQLGSSESYGTKSGLIPDPGKIIYLQLADHAIRDVNQQKKKDSLTYGRKAMIRCGFAKGTNELWEKTHLFPQLQNIIAKYEYNFDGADPDVLKD